MPTDHECERWTLLTVTCVQGRCLFWEYQAARRSDHGTCLHSSEWRPLTPSVPVKDRAPWAAPPPPPRLRLRPGSSCAYVIALSPGLRSHSGDGAHGLTHRTSRVSWAMFSFAGLAREDTAAEFTHVLGRVQFPFPGWLSAGPLSFLRLPAVVLERWKSYPVKTTK